MARRFRLIILAVPLLVWAAACANEPPQADDSAAATPPVAAPSETSVLQLDTTGRAVSATHRPTGRTHVLFDDETVEDSEEGTFYQLLSQFGPYVSYSQEWYYEGGAHPSYGKAYNAVSVGKAVEEADLRDLFAEETIYAALQQTELVRQTPLPHTTLSELIQGLATTYECDMSFDAFFSSFYVKAVDGEAAEVVVGLTHGCEVQRGNFTTFMLKMDVSEDKREMFTDLQTFKTED